jgi:hypothetical protein
MPFAPRARPLLALLFVLSAASHVEAGWWDWLEKHSGPGPFRGFEIPFEVACYERVEETFVTQAAIRSAAGLQVRVREGTPTSLFQRNVAALFDPANQQDQLFAAAWLTSQLAHLAASSSRSRRTRAPGLCSVREQQWMKGGTTELDAEGRDANLSALQTALNPGVQPGSDVVVLSRQTRRAWTVFVAPGYYESVENRLFTPADAPESQVSLFSLDVVTHTKLLSSLDVGFGAGTTVFWGDRFDTFARFHIVPVHFVWRPLMVIPVVHEKLEPLLGLRFGSRFFPTRLKASDFGSTSDFDEPGDIVWHVGLFVDVRYLIHLLDRGN